MAADTRKLKDSVTEFFKKGKFEKAASALEELIKAEPRETQHRLKLGDALRKTGEREKSILAYQTAAKAYGDEGQLIKAIAAIKVILEIDPANEAAQGQLSEMNERRFAKPGQYVQKATLPKAIGGARGVSAIELEEGESVASAIADQLGAISPGLSGGSDDGLELDDSHPPIRPPPPPADRGPRRRPNEHKEYEAIDLPDDDAAAPLVPDPPSMKVPPRRGQALITPLHNLDEVKPPAELELEEVQPEPESMELELTEVDAEPGTGPIMVQATPNRAVPPPPPLEAEVIEVDFELDPRPAASPRTSPQPIADLLATSDEEEVELLSISSDEELTPTTAPVSVPKIAATGADLDRAFSNIVDEPTQPMRKIPARVPLFSELSQEAFVELVNQLDYRVYEPGQVILREGDPGRSFYVISQGRVRVYKELPDGQVLTLAHLEDGAFFGEMAMLSGAPRTATIAAEVETHVLEVSDKVLRSLVQKHPQVTVTLKNFYRQRLLNNVMTISPLFKGFDAAERKQLMERFKMRQAATGEVLVVQGTKSDGLYVVLHGAVMVTAKAPNGEVDIARLKEGDIFGEMSLLTHKPSIATVTAAVPSLVLKLPREQFNEMILTHPQILELVSELTDKRRGATEAILKGQGVGVDGMAFV